MIDRLVGALDPDKGALIAVPTIEGQRGNPVVWSRRFFPTSYRRGRYRGAPSDRPVQRGRG